MQSLGRRERLALDAASVLGCWAVAWWMGADLNWDLINYHLYAPDLQFRRSLDQDFLGASLQGYLQGLMYLPLYAMVRMEASALTVSLVLATLHSVNLMLLHRIADLALPVRVARRGWIVALAAALGGMSAIFWAEVGTSFADALVSLPLLAGMLRWLQAAADGRADRSPVREAAILGGWIGLAVGLKLTALMWVPLWALYAWVRAGSRAVWAAMAMGAAALTSWGCIAGLWAWRLWQHHGNPFFPLFNQWFHSPDAVEVSYRHDRFTPASAWDAVLLAWRMALPDTHTYSEAFAADVRPLMFLVSVVLGVGVAVAQRSGHWWHNAWRRPPVMVVVWCFVMWWVWALTGANGRYAMPLWLMLGPALAAAWVTLWRGKRWSVYGLGLFICVQCLSHLGGGVERWGPHPWTDAFAKVAVPAQWRDRPYLFLSLQNQSYAFLSWQVHPDSGFVNLMGQVPLWEGGPGWPRVQALLDRHEGHWMALSQMPSQTDARWEETRERVIAAQRERLRSFGLTVPRQAACQRLPLHPPVQAPVELNPSQPHVVRQEAHQEARSGGEVLACPVQPLVGQAADDQRVFRQALAASDQVLAQVMRQCPQLEVGVPAVTLHEPERFFRVQFVTDLKVVLLPASGKVRAFGRHGEVELPDRCTQGLDLGLARRAFAQWQQTATYREAVAEVFRR
ncbi:hypothetical protein EYS42_08365 [Aquabacterium lacunae]|uniref:DUF2029 domain-containing protein n=1 Tax=Aquabacterium lacunae TaxID=2528630 RepID=A0A4Q9GYG1_9BURK|nr:hypothetical protein [Aquabacterium lacunae]TBO31251.1 hypothetical protein EYS42_08365 [Aquabacterium lacunae]